MAQHESSDDVGLSFSGGCIRFGEKSKSNPGGIYLHENNAHDSIGIRSFELDDKGRLLVRHSSPGPIVTMYATADESLVSRGIALGCSGGTGKTTIQVAQNGVPLDLRRDADYKRVSGQWCNAWLFWLHRKW